MWPGGVGSTDSAILILMCHQKWHQSGSMSSVVKTARPLRPAGQRPRNDQRWGLLWIAVTLRSAASPRSRGWLASSTPPFRRSGWSFIPRAEYWRSRLRLPYRVLVPLWIGMWVVLGVITAPWRNVSALSTPLGVGCPRRRSFCAGLWIIQAFRSRLQPGSTRRASRSHGRTSGAATGDLRHTRSRPPSDLSGAPMRNAGLERWHRVGGVLRLTVFALISGAIMIRLEDANWNSGSATSIVQYRRETGQQCCREMF